jgi:hypothetical protein
VVQGFDEEQHRAEEDGGDTDGEDVHASTLRPGLSSPCGVHDPVHQDAVKTAGGPVILSA